MTTGTPIRAPGAYYNPGNRWFSPRGPLVGQYVRPYGYGRGSWMPPFGSEETTDENGTPVIRGPGKRGSGRPGGGGGQTADEAIAAGGASLVTGGEGGAGPSRQSGRARSGYTGGGATPRAGEGEYTSPEGGRPGGSDIAAREESERSGTVGLEGRRIHNELYGPSLMGRPDPSLPGSGRNWLEEVEKQNREKIDETSTVNSQTYNQPDVREAIVLDSKGKVTKERVTYQQKIDDVYENISEKRFDAIQQKQQRELQARAESDDVGLPLGVVAEDDGSYSGVNPEWWMDDATKVPDLQEGVSINEWRWQQFAQGKNPGFLPQPGGYDVADAGDLVGGFTVSQARAMPRNLNNGWARDSKKVQEWQQFFRETGLFNEGDFQGGAPSLPGVWGIAEDKAFQGLLAWSYGQLPNETDPYEMMGAFAAAAQAQRQSDSSRGSGASDRSYPYTTTATNTTVSLTNLEDAGRVLRSLLASMIGRRATDQEAATFLSALNARERQSPTVTTTTTTVDEQGNQTSSTDTAQGGQVDAFDVAEDWVEGDKALSREYDSYQGLRYFLAMTDMLMSGGLPDPMSGEAPGLTF